MGEQRSRQACYAMDFTRVCIDMHQFDQGCSDANYFRSQPANEKAALSNFCDGGRHRTILYLAYRYAP